MSLPTRSAGNGYAVTAITSAKVLKKQEGSTHSDQLSARATASSLLGFKGDDALGGSSKGDYLDGGIGDDSLRAGRGDDVMVGGFGNDVLNGGAGRDMAVFTNADNTIRLNTKKRQKTGDGKDRLIGIEDVNAGAGNDSVIGSRQDNYLIGGLGADTLIGGKGNDTLAGGRGEDRLIASTNQERMFGGKGKDQFVLRRGKGYALIQDFDRGVDTVVIQSSRGNVQLRRVSSESRLTQGGDLLAVIRGDRVKDLSDLGL